MQKNLVATSLVLALSSTPVLSKEGAASVRDCEKNNFHACAIAGSHYQWGTGGLKEDMALTIKYYQRACDGNNAVGCFGLAMTYENPSNPGKSPAKAFEAYKKACDLRHEYACAAVDAMKKAR